MSECGAFRSVAVRADGTSMQLEPTDLVTVEVLVFN